MVEPQLISDPFGSNVSGHSYTEIGKQITEKYPGAQFNKIIKDKIIGNDVYTNRKNPKIIATDIAIQSLILLTSLGSFKYCIYVLHHCHNRYR